MGLNFRKSITICKGVKLNLSKSGVGVSAGVKGARVSINSKGQKRATVGIPGTGVYYTKTLGSSKKKTTSAAAKKKETIAKKKEEAVKNNADELEKNKLQVEEYDNYIERIRTVHLECEEPIDWHSLYREAEPFAKGSVGGLEAQAKEAYDNYQPGFFEKMNKAACEKKSEELKKAIDEAKKKDEEAYENWSAMHEFAEKVLQGDIDSYLEAINEASPFDDLVEYGSDFEVGTDKKDTMEVEFNVKSDLVVPKTSTTLLKTGKLSQKELTKTQYYDYVQDYVCSCAIRLAREIFAIVPVDYVIVHAQDGVVNTTNGHIEDYTILSVKFNRKAFEDVNFERIDPSDFVESYEHNMNFLKTAGFKAVDRVY